MKSSTSLHLHGLSTHLTTSGLDYGGALSPQGGTPPTPGKYSLGAGPHCGPWLDTSLAFCCWWGKVQTPLVQGPTFLIMYRPSPILSPEHGTSPPSHPVQKLRWAICSSLNNRLASVNTHHLQSSMLSTLCTSPHLICTITRREVGSFLTTPSSQE